MYVCMCLCVCVYVCVYVCMYVRMYVCIYACVSVYVLGIYVCICTYVCVYSFMHICVYICVCIYIYIWIHEIPSLVLDSSMRTELNEGNTKLFKSGIPIKWNFINMCLQFIWQNNGEFATHRMKIVKMVLLQEYGLRILNRNLFSLQYTKLICITNDNNFQVYLVFENTILSLLHCAFIPSV